MTADERRTIALGALTIYERLAAASPSNPVDITASRGRELLASWQQAFSPGDADAFARRLQWDGIEPSEVIAAACTNDAPDLSLEWTAWLDRFGAGARTVLCDLARHDVAADDVAWRDAVREDGARPAGGPDGGDERPFAELWTACALEARSLCAPADSARITTRAFDDLVAQLTRELAVYGELPVYELFATFRQARGIDPNEAAGSALYREFIVRTLAEQFATLFHDYPVAARQLARVAQGWVESTRELLERLDTDRDRLARVFNGGRDLGRVERIEAGLSDPHDGRRRVAILLFASGVRVVHKPRDLTVDAAFAQLLTWFACHGLESTPPAPRVVRGAGYGWAEWVEHGTFSSRAAVARYFEQAGSLLFLAHLLGARDLHMENLIASRAGPTIIDLEFLLQPGPRPSVAAADGSDEELVRTGESVLRTGLLSLVQIGPDDEPTDLGGVRGGGHTSSATRRLWIDVGTDAMRFRDEPAPPLPVKNAVWFEKRIAPPEHYVAEILGGFDRAYRVALETRTEMLDPAGPLACFQSAEIRVLVRPTEQYGLLSAVRNVPRYQRDAMTHSILVDALHRPLKDARVKPAGWPLVIEERRAVEALDVPRFVVGADRLTVCSSGCPVLSDYYGQSALDMVRNRIGRLSTRDREAQSRTLRHALTQNTATRFSRSCPIELTDQDNATGTATAAALVPVALWIGDELLRQADTDLADESQRQEPAAHFFYNGSIGAGVFLAALARITGAARWTAAARRSLEPCLDLVDRSDLDASVGAVNVGGLAGLGSIVLGLTYAGTLLRDATIVAAARRVAARIDGPRIASDRAHDVVDGTAGALLALLLLHAETHDEATLAAAIACGDHLISSQRPREAGRAWPGATGRAMVGFAHGAAGISTALLRLAKATGRATYRDAGLDGLAFVASLFSEREANWPIAEPDLDHDAVGVGRMNAWCHGAPGIALAAAEAVDVAPRLALVEQARRALPRIGRWDVAQADHLCCGHLGRVDALLTAGDRLGVPDAASAARLIAARVIARAGRHQHFRLSTAGVEFRVLDPGFFRGLSGIGYQLLRLAAPGRLPSVLGFEAVPTIDNHE